MNWFNNRSIGTKIVAPFALVTALGAALGAFTIIRLSTISTQVSALTQETMSDVMVASGTFHVIESLRTWILVLVPVLVVASIAIAFVMARRITAPLRELDAAASAMARGDLTAELHYAARDVVGELQTLIHAARDGRLGVRGNAVKFEGVYGELVSGTNALLDTLVEPLRFVAGNADALASSSEELTAVSQQLGS